MPLEYITNEIEEAKRFKRMQAENQEVCTLCNYFIAKCSKQIKPRFEVIYIKRYLTSFAETSC